MRSLLKYPRPALTQLRVSDPSNMHTWSLDHCVDSLARVCPNLEELYCLGPSLKAIEHPSLKRLFVYENARQPAVTGQSPTVCVSVPSWPSLDGDEQFRHLLDDYEMFRPCLEAVENETTRAAAGQKAATYCGDFDSPQALLVRFSNAGLARLNGPHFETTQLAACLLEQESDNPQFPQAVFHLKHNLSPGSISARTLVEVVTALLRFPLASPVRKSLEDFIKLLARWALGEVHEEAVQRLDDPDALLAAFECASAVVEFYRHYGLDLLLPLKNPPIDLEKAERFCKFLRDGSKEKVIRLNLGY